MAFENQDEARAAQAKSVEARKRNRERREALTVEVEAAGGSAAELRIAGLKVLEKIASNTRNAPAVRVQAAKAMIDDAWRLHELEVSIIADSTIWMVCPNSESHFTRGGHNDRFWCSVCTDQTEGAVGKPSIIQTSIYRNIEKNRTKILELDAEAYANVTYVSADDGDGDGGEDEGDSEDEEIELLTEAEARRMIAELEAKAELEDGAESNGSDWPSEKQQRDFQKLMAQVNG